MWITTKSIVKEIKKSQDDLAEKLEKIAIEQKDNLAVLQKQISVLTERLDYLEKLKLEDREKHNSDYSELARTVTEIGKLIKALQGELLANLESDTQKVNDLILSSSQNEIKAILACIQKSIDKVCDRLESIAGQSENSLREEIKQIKDCSTADEEKSTALLMESITAKFEQVEKLVQNMGNEVGHETKNYCDEISGGLKHISCAIQEMAALSESQDTVMSENIETMSIAMQEIIRNLLSLDEGNRLVIAKFLLRDMEN